MHRPKVLLVSLGGTITMTREAIGAGIAPTLGASDLVAAVASIDPVMGGVDR